MYNTNIPQSETSEWFMMNQGVAMNFGYTEGDHVTQMSQQLTQHTSDKLKTVNPRVGGYKYGL